jgi:hypothetical protein
MNTYQLMATIPDRTHSWFLVGCPHCKTVSGIIFYPNGACFHVACEWKGTVKDLWEPLPSAANPLLTN